MIKIIVVEDNRIVREGIIELLNDQQDITVVGKAKDAFQALELLKTEVETDIVLTDIDMEEMDGLTLTEKICSAHHKIKVVILTMHLHQKFIERAFEAGAKGYVLKSGNIDDVYDGIRKVFAGEEFVTAGF